VLRTDHPRLFAPAAGCCALLLLLLLAGLVPVSRAYARSGASSVNVNLESGTITSHLSTGVSLVDTSLFSSWSGNSPTAVGGANSIVSSAASFVNVPVMGWGSADPWPDPATPGPTNWGTLDSKMKMAIASGHTPVITLAEAPWWMKGQLQRDGTTKLIPDAQGDWAPHTYTTPVTDYRGINYPAGYVSPDPYAARILDNEMGKWLTLVEDVVRRYMAPPYNVRYFQVWNELKGYYNPGTNEYDYTTSPGDPSGYNAENGYTYMYNEVYERLMGVATSLGIPTTSVQVGGPYVVMQTWSNAKTESNPSNLTEAYGNFDERPLDVIKYWLQHKVGAGFITVDGSNTNSDGVNLTNDFTAAQKFGDVVSWIRSLDPAQYPGSTTLPVWWAEWYATPHSISGATPAADAAVKSYAIAYLLEHGGAVPLSWGEQGSWTADDGAGASLYTDTDQASGGEPYPWYYDYQAFKDDFGPGTRIYATSVSNSAKLAVLASAAHTMLINKTGRGLTVKLDGVRETLAPYQVAVTATRESTAFRRRTRTARRTRV
jgi:hypothetical protein